MRNKLTVPAVVFALTLLAASYHGRRARPSVQPLSADESRALRDAPDDLNAKNALEKAKENAAVENSVQIYGVPVGHAGEDVPGSYDIWSANCHTAANLFTAVAAYYHVPAGILVCQGDPEVSYQYHTANWVLEPDGRACILNWGGKCCWEATASAPDIKTGGGLECAKKACGKQYKDNETRVLPAGKLVEMPGPAVCTVIAAGGKPDMLPGLVTQMFLLRADAAGAKVKMPPHPSMPEGEELDFSPQNRGRCLECCEARTNAWSAEQWGKFKQEDFGSRCKAMCTLSFRGRETDGAGPPP